MSIETPYDARDHVVRSEGEARVRAATVLAIKVGRWAPVRAGLSRYPLDVEHCAHCDRYSGEHLWHHRSCRVIEDRSEASA